MDEKEVLIEQLKRENIINNKINTNYNIINDLLSNNGLKAIKEYILNNNVKNIVIYGAGTISKILFYRLSEITGVTVKAIIDKQYNDKFDFKNVQMLNIGEIYNLECDIVIVTPIFAYEEIKKNLEKNNIKNIVPIIDVI